MVSWSLKRRVAYIGTTAIFLAISIGWFLFVSYYQPPTCFDGKQNDLEAGIDCGGGCQYLCPFQVGDPVVLFSRSFKIADGVYNSIAYIENPNFDIGNRSVSYVFKLYDSNNELIAEREGRTFIAAGRISPVFEGNIRVEDIPTRTVFELLDNDKWQVVRGITESPLVIKNKQLKNADTFPRVEAVIENTSVEEFKDIEVVTVVFNALENAIATSRTFVDSLPRKGTAPLVFTWPRPFTTELEACTIPVDVALLIDVSGSMNNDGDDPPQPLTDAKEAARDFVERLTPTDRAGLAVFATQSRILERFTADHERVQDQISNIFISPEEEQGSTNMGDAIRNATFMLQNDSANRFDSEKVIILLTDGIANEPEDPGGEPYALQNGAFAKEQGFTIYTIAIGEEINAPFLRELATESGSVEDTYFYKAATSKDLGGIYEQISDSICERGPAIIDVIPRITDTPLTQ